MSERPQFTLWDLWDEVRWHRRSWDDIMNAPIFTKTSYTIFAAILGATAVAVIQARANIKASNAALKARLKLPAPGFPDTEVLEDFDWQNEEPEKYRPFKPKYHLTMADSTALEAMKPTELIVMDKNYKDRIMYRRQMLKEHHDVVVGVSNDKKIAPAVRELHEFLMCTYLPTRYPSMFRMHEAKWESGSSFMLENLVTGQMIPARPPKSTPTVQILEVLGQHLDEDFLLLLPEDGEKEDSKYIMEAYMTICASGFNPAEKLGKRLADIHEPVPGYAQKLEGSMDRFFTKLEVGKYVKRVNWSVTTNADLYAVGDATTHAHEGDVVEELDEIEVDKTFLRCERQTLHRLPHSQALVFAFKTYLYPISDIKEEGLGEELASAIDGLKAGNVPQMHFYKRGTVWGEAVKRYLRS